MKKAEAISILATSVRLREAKDRARYDEAVKMAIEALKSSEIPNGSDDTISRQAAIDLFPDDDLEYDTKGGYVAPHLARRMICELPSAQPDHVADIGKKAEKEDIQTEPHWIPCSERLPEDGRYLVTRFDFVTNTCFSDILWYEKGVWWNRLCIGDFAVIAWMPLPAPYKGGETE